MKERIKKKAAGILKKKPLKILLIAVLVLAVLGGTTFVLAKKTGLFGKKSSVQQLTAVVDKGAIEQIVEGSGSVKSATRKEVSSKVVSTIQTINFKTGDVVKTGDVMFELDNTDALVDIENTKNSIDETKLSLQDVQESIAALTVKAPFSGYITDLSIKEDDSLNGGGAIATLTDTSKLKVTLSFSGKKASDIVKGQKATLNIEDLMQSIQATVTYIGDIPYIKNGVQAYDIELTIDNPGTLSSGMTANAEIAVGTDTYTSMESASLEYYESKVIKNTSGGTVKSINVKKNEYVRAGEVLAIIENDSLQLNLSTVELKLKNLESQLEIQEKQLTYYTLTAPCNGTIISQDAVVGDTVSAGSSLAVVADMDTLEFSIAIDELDISNIQVGQTVSVTADAITDTQKNPLSGKVSEISMEGTSSNGVTTYPVTITLDKSDKLKTGMNVNGEIFISSKDDVLRVPVEAIKTIDDSSYVYVKSSSSTSKSGSMPSNEGDMPQPPSGGFGNGGPQDSSGNAQAQSNENNGQSGSSGTANGNTDNNTGSSSGTNSKDNTASSQQPPQGQGSKQNGQAAFGNRTQTNSDPYYSNAVLVKVETGISNDTYIEITSGLTEGQIVILPELSTDSTDTKTTKQNNMGGGMTGGMSGAGGPPNGGGGPGF